MYEHKEGVAMPAISPPRQDFFEEPTRLERLICAQFRRGMPVPLNPAEQQKMLNMNVEQRCDYVAKVCVWTARRVIEHIEKTEHLAPKKAEDHAGA